MPGRKSLIAAGAVLALLVALYAAAGFWIAPRFVRQALAEAAHSRGLVLEVARIRTQPFTLRVELAGIALSFPGGRNFAQAESASVDLAWASLWRRGWIAHEVRVDNGSLHYAPRELLLEALELRARELSTTQSWAGTFEASARLAGAGAGRLAASGGLVRRDGAFALRDLSVGGDGLAYAGIELPRVTLRAQEVPLPPGRPVAIEAQASIAPQGTLAARGSVGLEPLELHLELSAADLPLAEAQRWLPPGVAVRVASGALSGSGALDVSGARILYDGSARVGGLRLEERGSGALLLAWKEAEAAALRFDSSTPALEAEEIVVREPQGRLVIEQDGAVNLAAVLGGGDGGKALAASFGLLRIEEGVLQFADRSLATPFEATIRELSGTVAGFSTAANAPARVRLSGRVQPYGTARIRGTINLNSPATQADIAAVFRNLHLDAFNPYVAKFAGYRIESGRLSAELRYQVRDGALSGSNRLEFENMQLGNKLEERGLLDLPLELVVALLADSQGRINLAIPVRGDLRDPQFDLGAIVARALRNVVGKIVSAPFRALASLFGAGEGGDPGAIGFAPGSAALSPPAEENVARVAGALERRPQLGVEVRGGYDPARDRRALGMRAAREALASAAGAALPLDLSDAKVVRAAEALFLKAGGDRATLQALRQNETAYGRLLLQSLAASAPAHENAAQALGRERAEAVRVALLEHGLDPARVGISGVQESAGEAEVPTTLALKPAGQLAAAGTGATSAPAAPPADPVRAAQQKLNAAGFDAGPVDGNLGPRTKRALIHFQAVEGLELTGELDAPTRARLP